MVEETKEKERTIPTALKLTTRNRLKEHGLFRESWDAAINRLLDQLEEQYR